MSGRLLVLITLNLIFLSSCGEPADRVLVGKWRAVSVTEGADSVRLDPAEVVFEFLSDNRYTFASTLRYREAGTWTYRDGHLMAQDTTNTPAAERVVAVDKVTADSLVLRMNGEMEERIVVLLKE